MESNGQIVPEQLLGRARAGDDQALGKLLELYRNYLSALAGPQLGKRLQGKLDASDVVQETFMEAHRDFGQFRGTTEAEFMGWLRRILACNLANQVERYCGTKCRDLRLERDLAADLEKSSQALDRGFVAMGSSPSHQAARREQAALVANALGRLPKDYREVLVLRHLEGLTFREVARRMDRTVEGVKKLWARGLDRLRRSLRDSP